MFDKSAQGGPDAVARSPSPRSVVAHGPPEQIPGSDRDDESLDRRLFDELP